MANLKKPTFSWLFLFILAASQPHLALADDVCAAASLINPAIEQGIGGTGINQHGGTGGTGITAQGGIGGTGILERGGIGGTGIEPDLAQTALYDAPGGVAIKGVITGFASICVNGEEVHYSNNTPLFDNGQPAKLSQMAVGKTVMLKAERINGRLNARAIGLYDAVSGPINKVDFRNQQLQVAGQVVRLNQGVMQQAKVLTAASNVRISGYRQENGEIVATRIEPNNANNVSTLGVVTEVAPAYFKVNGTRVNISQAQQMDNIRVGSEVRVNGEWSGNAIKLSKIEYQPTNRLLSRAESAILEGYVRADKNGSKLTGSELSFTKKVPNAEAYNEKLMKIELRRNGRGEWEADNIEERKGRLFDAIKNTDKNTDKGSGSANSGKGSKGEEESVSNSNSNSNSGGKNDDSASASSSSSSSGSSSGGSSSGGSSGSGSSRSVSNSGSGRVQSGSSNQERSSRSGSSSSQSVSSGRVERTDKSGGSSGSGASGKGSGKN